MPKFDPGAVFFQTTFPVSLIIHDYFLICNELLFRLKKHTSTALVQFSMAFSRGLEGCGLTALGISGMDVGRGTPPLG